MNILLIEDNPEDARLIKEYLTPVDEGSFDVTVAERLDSGIELLRERSFDVVLLDLTLPDSAGLATFEKVRDQALMVPVIVLTGLDDKATGLAAVKAGAQDYLLKGEVDGPVLVRALKYSLERSYLESQILLSNQTLEERVELRTRELEAARDRAYRSEKLAIIGQLSGGVAHDLRNPLGAIRNAAFLLKKRNQNDWTNQSKDDVAQWIDVIEREVTRANDVITNLLSLGGSSKAMELSEIQVSDVIHGSLASSSLTQGIDRSLTIEPDLPPVLGNHPHLTRVIQNLIVNAQDSMGAAGRLTIDAQREESWVKIVVSDTGCGIDSADLEKIFEPLFTAKPHGTGLGLAICQEIINKHNGSISVESVIGVGTSFTVRIPVAPQR